MGGNGLHSDSIVEKLPRIYLIYIQPTLNKKKSQWGEVSLHRKMFKWYHSLSLTRPLVALRATLTSDVVLPIIIVHRRPVWEV